MIDLIVNLAGFVSIGLIVWWFWLSKPRAQRAAGVVDVLVDAGVYTPARIEVVAGKPVRLRFLRKDPSPCAQKVLFDGLEVSAELPLGRPREIVVTPPRPGEYEFTCEMHMYRGRLVAR